MNGDGRRRTFASPAAGDIAVLLVAGLFALGWDWLGADLAVVRLLGTPQGFPWRDAFLTSRVLHEGGRLLGWAVALGWVLYVLKPRWPGPPRRQRVLWLAAALASLLVVPAIKLRSLTSCPWDLAEFGGRASYVSHWAFGVADGGPGRCFPSGHATAAFAFLAGYFMLRARHPRAARAWLGAVCATGLAFGLAQVARGAHYPSHVLWTGWICWTICVAAAHGLPRAESAFADPLSRAEWTPPAPGRRIAVKPSGNDTDSAACPPSRPR